MPDRKPLTLPEILAWADRFHSLVGRWPTREDGARHVPESNWSAIDQCLKMGLRGLSPGSSLAKLLLDCRQRRHKGLLPRLTTDLILRWADAHRASTKSWPKQTSGRVSAAPGETWAAIDTALDIGGRGLPGGSSLARLLHEQRGVRNAAALPRLTIARILARADAHHARTGEWPHRDDETFAGDASESWQAIDSALKKGLRGLPGGQSLATVLAAKRGVRNIGQLPRLSRRSILAWADAHRERTGEWPMADSGPIPGAAGETWMSVDTALISGTRGVTGGDSLARFLARHRGKRNPADLPPLTERRILAWCDAHYARCGRWPSKQSGAILESPGDSWQAINTALVRGGRGLAGGRSLAQLLAKARSARNKQDLPPLTLRRILAWADAHRARTGDWPKNESGPVTDAPGETWSGVNAALRVGGRAPGPKNVVIGSWGQFGGSIRCKNQTMSSIGEPFPDQTTVDGGVENTVRSGGRRWDPSPS